MSAHTPGPWALHIDGFTVFGGGPNDRQQVADCETGSSPNLPIDECHANARLIAAAPELLEACRAGYLSLLRLSPIDRLSRQDALCALRDAIAAATGDTDENTQNKYESVARAHNAHIDGTGAKP